MQGSSVAHSFLKSRNICGVSDIGTLLTWGLIFRTPYSILTMTVPMVCHNTGPEN